MKKGTLIGLGIAGIVSGVLAYLYLTPSGQSLLNSSGLSEYLPSGSAFTTFGSSGSSGGIGSTPSDVYDYISPSNNPNNLSNSQAFKSNYKQLGAIAVSPSKIPASQIPIGYKEKPSTIINNPSLTTITKTISQNKTITAYSNNNYISKLITSNQPLSKNFVVNIVNNPNLLQKVMQKVNSNKVNQFVTLPYGINSSGYAFLNGKLVSKSSANANTILNAISNGYSKLYGNSNTTLPSSNPYLLNITQNKVYNLPALQLQNGSIFPFINASNSSTNSSLLYNGTAYAGNYFGNNKSGNYYLPLNNSQIAKLNNVTNNSYILNAQNVSAVNDNTIISNLNKSNTTVTKVSNSSSSSSSSFVDNISSNPNLLQKIKV